MTSNLNQSWLLLLFSKWPRHLYPGGSLRTLHQTNWPAFEQDLAINLPGSFRLFFLLSFIRKTKNAWLKNPTDLHYLLHKNLMKSLNMLVFFSLIKEKLTKYIIPCQNYIFTPDHLHFVLPQPSELFQKLNLNDCVDTRCALHIPQVWKDVSTDSEFPLRLWPLPPFLMSSWPSCQSLKTIKNFF